jgi:hypothetical protein
MPGRDGSIFNVSRLLDDDLDEELKRVSGI